MIDEWTKVGNVTFRKTGTMKIISSGYADRFPLSTCWAEILPNAYRPWFKIRIDNLADLPAALLLANGMRECDADDLKAATRIASMTRFGLLSISGERITKGGFREIFSIGTTSKRIQAGIDQCTGFPNMNEIGASRAKEIAETLTEYEWDAIYSGLDAVNREHERLGKPIVDYSRCETQRSNDYDQNYVRREFALYQ